MKTIEIKETLDLPLAKVWELFIDPRNYVKYFKYINKVFYKGQMKPGFVWYDFATFVFPAVVKHKVTVFEKEKHLGFDVDLPLGGYIKERINFMRKDGYTQIKAKIDFDFGNPIFSLLFDDLFEKRMKESVGGALIKLNQESHLLD